NHPRPSRTEFSFFNEDLVLYLVLKSILHVNSSITDGRYATMTDRSHDQTDHVYSRILEFSEDTPVSHSEVPSRALSDATTIIAYPPAICPYYKCDEAPRMRFVLFFLWICLKHLSIDNFDFGVGIELMSLYVSDPGTPTSNINATGGYYKDGSRRDVTYLEVFFVIIGYHSGEGWA
ncbi:hypothetical protein K440DRAFT_674443, partial [Wilcoxina mikolae CBS 423.85]